MSNALTGGFDAVLEVRRKTIRRFLAAMHEHGGDAAQDDLPRLPHNMVFRVGDETAVGGVRGKVQAQLGVPRIEPVMGAEIGPAAVGKVVVVYPVRAWFRPDPGTTPLPPFIHGDLHATFRVTLEAQPGGATLRFTPGDAAEFSFLSAGLSPAAAGQVAQQARHFLQGWSAKQPFLAVLGALDFPVRAKGVGETVAVPLPLPGGQPPPANLGGVTQDFTLVPAGGPADFAVAVSREYVLGLVQSFLDQVKASHPTFKVDPPWPLPDSTYTVHVHKAVADWKPAGSSVTIKLTFEGDATTPTILPNADWSVDLAFVVSFDDVAKTLVLAAAGDPVVSVDVHGPAGGLVEGDARARVEAEVKKQRAAALPAIQTAAGGVLPAQIARLTGLLHALVSYATVSVKGARFEADGVVLYGGIGMAPRSPAAQVKIGELADGSGYSAFANWLPGGWITSYRWLWTSWPIDPVTGKPIIEAQPGPLGTHVWPHEEKTLGDRFVLQQGPGVKLPGLDGGAGAAAASPLWSLCLYVQGTQVDPGTGDDATYPLNPWGPLYPGYKPPDAIELITSLDESGVHPSSCWLGETGTPEVLGVWPKQYWEPHPAHGLWIEWTWVDHDVRPGGGTYTGHLDLIAHADLGVPAGGQPAVYMFLADGSAAPALGRLGDALRAAGTTPEPVSVVLVRPAGTIGIETATAIRAFSREFPRTRLLVHEDIQGGWSRLLRVPAGPAAGGAVRVVDAARRLAFQGDRSVDAEALARALGRLDAGGAPGRARPLIPIVGPGVRPRDLLVELVPGSPISLRHLRRRPLALAFAREWSVPCRAALQELASAHRRLAEGGITVVGVLAGAGADHAKTFGAREGLPFPVVADPDAALARSCEICLWPTVLWMEGGHVRARAGASSAALAAWSQGGRTGPVS